MDNLADMAPPPIRADAESSAMWDGLLALIRQTGGWKDEYAEVLGMLVESLLSYRRALREFAEGGRKSLIRSARGAQYRNPLLDVIQTHMMTALRILTAFGLSPQVRGVKTAADGLGNLLDQLDHPTPANTE